jgi:hypothetical protein
MGLGGGKRDLDEASKEGNRRQGRRRRRGHRQPRVSPSPKSHTTIRPAKSSRSGRRTPTSPERGRDLPGSRVGPTEDHARHAYRSPPLPPPPPPAWPRARANTHGRRSPRRRQHRHRHPEPPLRRPKAPTEGAARSASDGL